MAEHGKLDIERYFAGEADEKSAALTQEHFRTCASCTAYLAKLESDRAAFLLRKPFAAFERGRSAALKDPWYRRMLQSIMRPALVPAFAAVLLALVALPIVRPYLEGRRPDSAIAYKGGKTLAFVYQRNGAIMPGNPADTFSAGDRIQVLYAAPRAGHIALFSIDGGGAVSFYQPDAHAEYCTVPTAAGADQTFPSSIVLDSAHGQELVVALFSPRPVAAAAVADWAARYAGQGPRDIRKALRKDRICGECTATTLLLNKR
jgi:anti-sigma factor RsiW